MLRAVSLVLWVGFAGKGPEAGRENGGNHGTGQGSLSRTARGCPVPGGDTAVLSLPGALTFSGPTSRGHWTQKEGHSETPGQAPVFIFCSGSLGGQGQAQGDAVNQSILVHKIWKHESMNCNRA